VVRSHQSVDWGKYFDSIKEQCPWSLSAWLKNQIDVVDWEGSVIPLSPFQARIYTVGSDTEAETLANELDVGEDEWLFSYSEYGEFGTPIPVIIQQNRKQLNYLRSKLDEKDV
jgi:hypothetical protein